MPEDHKKDQKSKVLIDRLKELPEDQTVYIGGKCGRSFIFIGTVKTLFKHFTELDMKYKLQTLSFAGNKLEDAKATINSIEEAQANEDPETAKEEMQTLKDLVNEAYKAHNRVRNWTPIAKRRIVEEYQHYSENPGITFLIEGNFIGTYWSYKEETGEKYIKKGKRNEHDKS